MFESAVMLSEDAYYELSLEVFFDSFLILLGVERKVREREREREEREREKKVKPI